MAYAFHDSDFDQFSQTDEENARKRRILMQTGTISVIGLQFCNAYPIQLTLHVSNVVRKSRIVSDSLGNPLFSVESPNILSLKSKQILRDPTGIPLLTLCRSELCSLYKTWEAFEGLERHREFLLFRVRKSRIFQLRTSLNVYLGGRSLTGIPDFTIKVDFSSASSRIFQGRRLIAQIWKKSPMILRFVGKHKLEIGVHAGVDSAFVTALALVVDPFAGDPWIFR